MAAEQSFLPICELSAYQSKWTIKARVTDKAPLRTFNKNFGTGQGKVFAIQLLDAVGSEIKASLFNEAADKYFNILEKGKCFTFSRGSVKVANKRYNTTNHRYELVFDKDAVMEEAADDSNIEAIKFNFVSLKALQSKSLPCTADVCAVVTDFKPTFPVTGKDGSELVKREITIADDSATSMMVTLWAERATQPDKVFEGNPVILLKSVFVTEWNESRRGSLLQAGSLVFGSDVTEAKRVQQWWAQGGSSQNLLQLSQTSGSAGDSRARNATSTTLAGVRHAAERLGTQAELFSVTARLGLVQTRKQGEVQPLHYMACQEPRDGKAGALPCNRRVDEKGYCAVCGKSGKVAPRLNMRCRFVDFEDQAWLTCFHEGMCKILGMSGEEVREMELKAAEKGEAGREELDNTIRAKYFDKPMSVVVRAKMGSYNGEPRADIGVIDARPVSYGEHGRHMLKAIHSLLEHGAQGGA